jgi:hypothetical protein
MSAALRTLVALGLVVPASAGATGSAPARHPSVALTASPAHVTLHGSAKTAVLISNTGRARLVVDVQRAGFALDLRGRPRIVARRGRTAGSWLAVRPKSLSLQPGTSATLTVSAKLPRHVEPGDHDALILLTTRPRDHAGLAVRMRLGVVVAIRAPGRVVRGLALGALAVRRSGHGRQLELLVANRGNVTEELASSRVSVILRRNGRTIARLKPEPRRLLPRTSGLVVFHYGGRGRGVVTAVATVMPTPGVPTLRRTFRVRL